MGNQIMEEDRTARFAEEAVEAALERQAQAGFKYSPLKTQPIRKPDVPALAYPNGMDSSPVGA